MSTAPRKRGRPPKTSFDDLVNKAMELMAAEPDKPLSLHGLAKAVGITPMAIYRYAEDRDELLQEVANRLLQNLKPVMPDQPWPEQLRYWAFSTRDYFLKNPELFTIMGWQQHIASAWLSQLAILARILQQAGLSEAALANTVQWVSNTVMGAIYMEISSKRSGYKVSKTDIYQLPNDEAELVESLMKHLWNKNSKSVFTDCIERVIANLQEFQ